MFVCNFSEMFVMLSSVGTRTFHSVSVARLNTDKRKAEAGVSVGSCVWESCGWGCEPAGPRRCRCVRVPSWMWGHRCFRCTTAPTRPERPAQKEPLRREPPREEILFHLHVFVIFCFCDTRKSNYNFIPVYTSKSPKSFPLISNGAKTPISRAVPPSKSISTAKARASLQWERPSHRPIRRLWRRKREVKERQTHRSLI